MNRKQQLQYKDQFLSHVSHELRTPLTCAHQFVTIVLDGLAGPISAEQRDHLETALGSIHQFTHMIGGLLDATRAESGKNTHRAALCCGRRRGGAGGCHDAAHRQGKAGQPGSDR